MLLVQSNVRQKLIIRGSFGPNTKNHLGSIRDGHLDIHILSPEKTATHFFFKVKQKLINNQNFPILFHCLGF